MSNEEIFLVQNDKDWKKIHQEIFGNEVPEHQEWTNISEIVSVLNKIGRIKNSNHTFFPDGGGLDLDGAVKSREKDAIELKMGDLSHIVKPKKLIFEGFDEEFEWNYFRLETEVLEPSGVYGKTSNDSYDEEVMEITPGKYVSIVYWDEGEYHGEPLPETARVVIRNFRGAFVIFKKTSIYNNNSSTYDGRHEKMGVEGFKDHIRGAINYVKNKK